MKCTHEKVKKSFCLQTARTQGARFLLLATNPNSEQTQPSLQSLSPWIWTSRHLDSLTSTAFQSFSSQMSHQGISRYSVLFPVSVATTGQTAIFIVPDSWWLVEFSIQRSRIYGKCDFPFHTGIP